MSLLYYNYHLIIKFCSRVVGVNISEFCHIIKTLLGVNREYLAQFENRIHYSDCPKCFISRINEVSSVSLSLSHWYPGSGVVLDCIDS